MNKNKNKIQNEETLTDNQKEMIKMFEEYRVNAADFFNKHNCMAARRARAALSSIAVLSKIIRKEIQEEKFRVKEAKGQ